MRSISAARRRGGGSMVEIRQSFAKICAKEECMGERGRRRPARGMMCCAPAPPSSLYRRGGLPWPLLQALGSAKKGGQLPPQVDPLFSRDLALSLYPMGMGLGGLVCWPMWACALPLGPCGTSRTGGPHYGTLRNLLQTSRYNTGKFPNFSGTLEILSHMFFFISGPFRST